MAEQNIPQAAVNDLRYIQEHESELNQFFKQMNFKQKDFQTHTTDEAAKGQSKSQEPSQSQKNKPPAQYKNYRGQRILPIQKLRQNYDKAIPGTKWITLPYCRRTIFGKIQFWCGASFIFTYMWASYYMRKNNLTKLSWKYYRNAYGLFALASTAYVFTESIFFEPYCDINSYHYKQGDNLFVARDIKKQLRDLTKE